MSDRLYYPFAAIFIGLIIALALMGPSIMNPPPAAINYADGFVMEGEGLRNLVPGPGTSIDFAGNGDVRTAYAIVAANALRENVPASAGLFGFLNEGYEAAFGGKRIRLTVLARAGADKPSSEFTLTYHTANVGDSPRTPFTLTPQFEEYFIEYDVKPPTDANPPGDYAGMWPDTSGRGGTMDVQRLSVKIIE